MFQKLSCYVQAYSSSGNILLCFFLLNPSRTSSDVPSSMNTPTPHKQNYTLHPNSPAAIRAFLTQVCDFFQHVSPSWTMNSSGKGLSLIHLAWHTVGINKLPEMDGWTDRWMKVYLGELCEVPLDHSPLSVGIKNASRSSCKICCHPLPLPSRLQYSIPSLSSRTHWAPALCGTVMGLGDSHQRTPWNWDREWAECFACLGPSCSAGLNTQTFT